MNVVADGSLLPIASPACPLARAIFALLFCAACFAGATRAQEVAPHDSAPPKKYIPDETRARLDSVKNVKDRVKLALQLADERILDAAAHTEAERYAEAGNQLGIYEAIINDTILVIHRAGRKNDKMRDTFKRVELALRTHVPRLESLRRVTPSDEAIHIRSCIEFVRDARTRALESFYDDTVLRMPREEKNKEDVEDGSARTVTRVPPEKKPDQN